MKEVTVTLYLSDNGLKYKHKEHAIMADNDFQADKIFGDGNIKLGPNVYVTTGSMIEWVEENRDKIAEYLNTLDDMEQGS